MINPYIKHILFILALVLSFAMQTQAQQSSDYNSTITSADKYYQSKDYYNAKATYQLASKLKPDESYPKDQIAEIIAILKAEMLVRGEYDELVELADEAFAQKDYSLAITNYEKALTIISYEPHPKEQLDKARELKAAASQTESSYNDAIKNADEFFINEAYQEALSAYNKAATIDESKKYPNDQVLKITNILRTQNANQLAYEQAIVKGDQLLNYQKFSEALIQYELALVKKVNDEYAVGQVDKMRLFIQKEIEYDKITKKADELYMAKDFVSAKATYQQAVAILPEKTYASNMISKIDASIADAQQQQDDLNKTYSDYINKADAFFSDEKYQAAYSKYNKALELKPNEQYPNDKLLDIDIILAGGYLEVSFFVHENNDGLFDSRVQLLEKGRVLETAEIGNNGKYKIKLDLNRSYQIDVYKEGYVRKIFTINTSLPREVNHNNVFEYELTVELFEKCNTDLSLFDEPLAEIKYYESKRNFYYDERKARIMLSKISNLELECKELLKQEKKQTEYDKLIVQADKYFVQSKYAEAIENYTLASAVLLKMEYPKQKLAEIKALLESADKYQALIISADAKFKAKNYEKALYDYYEAKNLKPNESYPPEKIAEIDAIILAQKAIDDEFLAFISTADKQYKNDSLSMAVVSYKLALGVKSKEEYPATQINKIEQEIKNRNELNKKYSDAIANADKLFESGNLNEAKAAFIIATQIKPNEMYPKYKVEDINTIEEQRRLLALNDNYETVLSEADKLFNAENYQEALPLYQQASKIKPKEDYPPAQIVKINSLLAQLAENKEKYDALIVSADQKFLNKEYASSFDDYKLALGIFQNEQYPKDRMLEIEGIMKAMADIQLAYQEAVRQGDASFEAKVWTDALLNYKKANELKPNETYPPEKIAEINTLLKSQADAETNYLAAIQKGDQHYEAKDWSLAITAYNMALEIKPNEAYPIAQVSKIQALLKNLEDQQLAYDNAIKTADELFLSEKYLESKSYYQQASNVFPAEEYPKTRILEIETLLKSISDNNALYVQLIAQADELFLKEAYHEALNDYKKAKEIKPEEVYPKEKIKEIEALLMASAEKDRLYTEAIAEADKARDEKAYPLAMTKYNDALSYKPQEEYPIEQIGLIQAMLNKLLDQQNAYDELIASADAKFNLKEWEGALLLYQQSLEVKPEEVYPKSKILEIEDIMNKIAEKNAAYDKAIVSADGFYKSETWIEALDNYEIASQIKPEEIYPKEKIAELNALLGDMAAKDSKYKALIAEADLTFSNKDYENSKSKYQEALLIKTEEYPQQRIREIETILAQIAADQQAYTQLIAEADALFGKKDWSSALDKYKGALALKPQEVYPQEQIQIINTKLQNLADKQSNYEALIAEADQYFENKEYEAAMLKYEAAAVILPQEKYPPQRIAEIRSILDGLAKQLAEYETLIKEADALLLQNNLKASKEKYQQAVLIFINREYPKEQIIKIDALIAKDNAYAEYITQADILFTQKDYNQSMSTYQQALALFPEKEYPQEQISEIQTILAALKDAQAAYDEAVRKGDVNYTAADYVLAKENYNEALTYIPTEAYPRQKIMEIDQILQDLARKQMQYDELIATADRLFAENNYEAALGKYKAASSVFPDKTYPPQKIAEINDILTQLKDKKTFYDKLIVEGDAALAEKEYQNCITKFEQALAIYPNEPYPLQRINEAKKALALIQRDIDVAYQRAIQQGDKEFGKKSWNMAKQAYQTASQIKPDELYPKEKLAEINSLIEAQLKALQNQYDRYIADGDRFYSTKYYQESIRSFENALGVFPEEKYPADMIEKIFDLIKKNSMVSILDGNITIYNNKKQKFKFSPIAYKDRKENYVLIEVRVVDENAKVKLYVNFGENNAQNGGYSISLKNKETYSRYFVNLGKQTRWVSKDNDFLSILPEGGDVEVKLIKISRNGL